MKIFFLIGALFLIVSPEKTLAQSGTLVDVSVIEAAIAENDPDALLIELDGKSIQLSSDQYQQSRRLIIQYTATLSETDLKEKVRVANALTAIALAEAGLSNTATPSEEAPILPQQLPAGLLSAIEANDGAAAVGIVRAQGFRLDPSTNGRESVIKLILDYVRPIPSSNVIANKEAYEALALLEPQNAIFSEKAASYAQAEKEARLVVLSRLKRQVDDFNGLTFYTSRAEPEYADTRSYLLPYIATKGSLVTLRVELHYTSDSWLFVQRARLNVDGEQIDFNVPQSAWKRDNDSEIWEWVDVVVDSRMRELLEAVANSKKTIIRLDGQQYYDDFTVSERDKAAIREILLAEEVLRSEN